MECAERGAIGYMEAGFTMMPHLRYLWYVLRHKWYVFQAGRVLKVPVWQLLMHDLSKFTPAEWFPYVAYFYGPGPFVAALVRRSQRKDEE